MFSILIVSLSKFISAHDGENYYGHHMMGNMINGVWGWGMVGFFGWLFMILIIIAIILLIIWLFQQIDKNNRRKK